ncbi:MAG TPA: magnesium transporter CorA family protein [Polyangiaceae bacterium]|nr:magnesium transporter CorA family protein [Polyangiaceae bacterium]
MLRNYPEGGQPQPDAIWIDLCNASDAERAEVQRVTGLRVPDQSAVREIETTSRVYTENDALYLSTPLPASEGASEPLSAVGFVLTRRVLISVRFSTDAVFDSLFRGCQGTPPHSAREIFLRILEALVDRAADTLEHCSSQLDEESHRAFHADKQRRRAPKTVSEKLRGTLRRLGQIGDHISQIRDTLLGFGRIAAFVCETSNGLIAADERPRLLAVRADISSLNDYQQHLSGKVQFLLDATLGFISIEQNDVVKALTIVSVVGVPPVLVAGIYGMNFAHMPELHWRFGYPFALLLMLVTGLLPLLWFRWRGWM